MPSRLRQPVSRLHTRRCVRCGYDGALLKGGRAPRCARCGCDLRSRPAMTYAEMEGFLDVREEGARPAAAADVPNARPQTQARVIERWLALLIVIIALMAAAAVVVARGTR